MNWFFTDTLSDTAWITGEDAIHITRSLRMAVGEILTLCDNEGTEHLCKIERICEEGVFVREMSKEACQNEPSVKVTLFAALTKGDKFESMVQKSVELGVHTIVPVLTERCISRPDDKTAEKKVQRYQKIAFQAAMQSHRNIVPRVEALCTLKKATESLSSFDVGILFYEGGGKSLCEVLPADTKTVAVFIGPEGGFGENEVELLTNNSAVCTTLGKRILRAETAPLAALSIIMFHTGNMN